MSCMTAPAVSISLSGICFSLRSAPFLQVLSTLGTLTPQDALARLNIPLHASLHSKRRTLPSHVISLLQSGNAIRLFANIEYEVDELRRDITVCNLEPAYARITMMMTTLTFEYDHIHPTPLFYTTTYECVTQTTGHSCWRLNL